MQHRDPVVVRHSFQLPKALMDTFRDGCERRGINMSALHRTFVEAKVQEFAREDKTKEEAETAA